MTSRSDEYTIGLKCDIATETIAIRAAELIICSDFICKVAFSFYSIRLKWMLLPLPLPHFTRILSFNNSVFVRHIHAVNFQIIFSNRKNLKRLDLLSNGNRKRCERINERTNVRSSARHFGFVKINIIYLHAHQHWWNHYHPTLEFLAE